LVKVILDSNTENGLKKSMGSTGGLEQREIQVVEKLQFFLGFGHKLKEDSS
jgi:hypothetical protein